MRVIAGVAKGRSLLVPRGLSVRPSSSRMRESAFGILDHRGAISGARVLDLYAGSGALGIEALSRGAESVLAVEKDRKVAALLERNAESCGFAARLDLRVAPVGRVLAGLAPASFDLILADPPYADPDVGRLATDVAASGVLRAGGTLMIEHSARRTVDRPAGMEEAGSRRYGATHLSVFRQEQERSDESVGPVGTKEVGCHGNE